MSQGKVVTFKKPGDLSPDPLTELLRTGAQQLIAQAVEAELHAFLRQFSAITDEQGRQSSWYAMAICQKGRFKPA